MKSPAMRDSIFIPTNTLNWAGSSNSLTSGWLIRFQQSTWHLDQMRTAESINTQQDVGLIAAIIGKTVITSGSTGQHQYSSILFFSALCKSCNSLFLLVKSPCFPCMSWTLFWLLWNLCSPEVQF